VPAAPAYPTPARRALITGAIMLSTMIVAIDGTIANVALPQMQASLSATPEQVLWVLTSYLVAAAIMTPLSSWLANRYGRKRVMVIEALGFTLSSVACGMSASLPMMVAARLAQGAFGAGLVPLGQATLLDINPPEKQGRAMALAGLGAMIGPLSGPTLGGWLTDALSWRWVFLINVPIGILAVIGLWSTMPETRDERVTRFDLMGFATVSIFIGMLQLMMDRGQMLDWFESREIWIEATMVGVFGWLAAVHMMTARNTFVRVDVFRDRNFAVGCLLSATIGIVVFATVPITTVMQQQLLGYTPLHAGMVSLPRGFGTVLGLLVVGSLIGKVDERWLLAIGLATASASLYLFSRISLQVDEGPLLWGGFLQGLSGGLMIAPLSTLVFSTLDSRLRNEGAAIYALARSIGQSLGISALQAQTLRNTAAVSSRLAERVVPDNPVVAFAAPELSFEGGVPLRIMAGQIGRQAAMVATIDTLWLTCLIGIGMIPMIWLMRRRARPG